MKTTKSNQISLWVNDNNQIDYITNYRKQKIRTDSKMTDILEVTEMAKLSTKVSIQDVRQKMRE